MTSLKVLIALLGVAAANAAVNATAVEIDAAGVEAVMPTEEAAPDAQVEGLSADAEAQMEETAEKHQFQAETNRLMDIIINSLYTDKLVFLRELVSNAADALEKVRLHSVQEPDYLGETKDLEIKVEFDDEAKTLTLTDTGVGMSKADLINNLGTVAKSGTSNFVEAMSEGSDSNTNLIGQFGVGFYSAFLVADKVTVASKNNDDGTQHVWQSSADASFTVAEDARGNTLGRGSRITLHLKEDAHELLSEDKLKELIGKFSQFINFPIYVRTKKTVEEEADDDDDLDDDEDEDEEKEKEPKATVKKTVFEWDQVNTQKAIWLRSKDEIKEEEYNEFYKAMSKDYKEPLAYSHFNAEGEVEFKSLLFLPFKPPVGFMDNFWTMAPEVKLYVRRVLVAESVEDLLPRYLRFMRGVVDADDLPLNVSRENLQQNKMIKIIAKKLVRKVLDLIRKLSKDDEKAAREAAEKDSEDKEAEEKDADKKEDKKDEDKKPKYTEFFEEYGKYLKVGCQDDDANRSKIAKLLRFKSTKSDKFLSFEEYIERAKENQDSIYYMSGESLEVMKKSPALQIFKEKDLEVLLLDNHMDEPCFEKLESYEGKKLVSIQKGDLKLPETEEEKKHFERVKKHFEPLTTWMKKTVKDTIDNGDLKGSDLILGNVELSKRLVGAPSALVSSKSGKSAHEEKMLRAQALGRNIPVEWIVGQKTYELNPKHPIVKDLLEKVKANPEDEQAKITAALLFQSAMLQQGYEIKDSSALVGRIHGMMAKDIGLDLDTPFTSVEIPEEPEEAEKDDEDDAEEIAADESADEPESDAEAAEEPALEESNEAAAEESAAEESKEAPVEESAAEESKDEL